MSNRPESSAGWLGHLLTHLGSAKQGTRYQCPAHPDDAPSLSVRDMGNGWAAIKCFGGCSTDDVLGALRLTRRVLAQPMYTAPEDFARIAELDVLFPPVRHSSGGSGSGSANGIRVAEYPYVPYTGGPALWRHVRYRDPKGFPWEHWSPINGGLWLEGLNRQLLTGLPLYGWQTLYRPGPVYWVEGEKDAHAADDLGVATVATGGGGGLGALPDDLSPVAGRDVVIVVDRDEPGGIYAQRVAARLLDLDCSVQFARSRTDNSGADLSDHLAAGYTLDDLELGKVATP